MQTGERPRFRQDLVAEPIEDGGARFIDVADPDSGHMYRFFEVEYSLACAMDGERDVAGIVRWAEEELGLKPSPNEVRSVIATLGDLGYLESGAAAAAAVNAAAAAQPVAEAPRAKAPPVEAPARKPEVELERGVVAAAPSRPAAPSVDVELGASGGRAPAPAAPVPSADFELGAPGSSAPQAPARSKVEDIGLGASGAATGAGRTPAMSTDLAADMAISPADVKEAVRASQVMKSVDVPPELAAELEPAKPVETKPAAAARQPEPVQAKPAEAPKQKPVEMPTERPVQPKAPTAPSSGVSPVLIGVLVLVVLAAAGFFVYKYVLKKKDAEPQTKVEAPVQPTPPVPPPPPPVETAQLAVEQPAPEEIKPTTAATVATIVANDTAVQAGEPIARLVGYKPLETETAALQKTIDKAKADLEKATNDRDAAQTAGNKAGVTQNENKIAALTKTLTTAEGNLATKTAALDKLLIKAPAAGKVAAVAKEKAKVTPTDIIATLTRDPILVATFKSAGEVAPDTRVLLAIKGSEQRLQCTVVASGGDGTKIACPQGAAPEGTEVSYAGVDPDAPAPGATPETPTPAPETGSADPAAGSGDEPAEEPAEQPAEKKAAKRPARRAQPKKAAEKPAEPAEKPAEPAPAPAGSGA